MIHRQKGFSLIELLCAMMIGIILLLMSFEIILNYKRSYHIQNQLAEVQENARFVSHYLKSSVKSVGFIGYRQATEMNIIKVYEGQKNGWIPNLPATFHIKPKKGSDVIESRNKIYYLSETKGIYQKEMGGRSDEIVSNVSAFNVKCDEMIKQRLINTIPAYVKNWQNVVLLEITMKLIGSSKTIYKKEYPYQFSIPIEENLSHERVS